MHRTELSYSMRPRTRARMNILKEEKKENDGFSVTNDVRQKTPLDVADKILVGYTQKT